MIFPCKNGEKDLKCIVRIPHSNHTEVAFAYGGDGSFEMGNKMLLRGNEQSGETNLPANSV